MRIASFNVENLFLRAKVLNHSTWDIGEPALQAFERFNRTSNKLTYNAGDRRRMLEDLEALRIVFRDSNNILRLQRDMDRQLALLRENRGDFLVQRQNADAEIVAVGRDDWIGWVELIPELVDDVAIQSTAQVIEEIDADVIGLVEVENRHALVQFNEDQLRGRYGHVMLVDGNDPRGIDVGIMTAPSIEIASIRSHVDDRRPAPHEHRTLFSRDAPVYQLRSGSTELWVIVNHLKSQSFSSGDPDPLRRMQAERVIDIYQEIRNEGATNVVVLGDFNKGPTNDTPPQHPTLEAFFDGRSDLVDVTTLPAFRIGPRPGTFQACGMRDRLDYIFLSPELAATVTDGEVNRSGLWGGPDNVNPPQDWTIYPTITSARHAASDHAALWVEVSI